MQAYIKIKLQIRGSFQKFCTLYVFALKMNLFYKIHLQVFNVISIVLFHSSPTFGQVLHSCLDAFDFDASDYSGHLIRHLLNASDAFSTEWFLQFWEQVKVWWAQPTRPSSVTNKLVLILSRWRKVVAQILWPVPDAAVTVLCTPDDVCDGHPKHVEWFFSKWIPEYGRILLDLINLELRCMKPRI
jgi:hypothetical protein